jgi:hypothetical protein
MVADRRSLEKTVLFLTLFIALLSQRRQPAGCFINFTFPNKKTCKIFPNFITTPLRLGDNKSKICCPCFINQCGGTEAGAGARAITSAIAYGADQQHFAGAGAGASKKNIYSLLNFVLD